MDTSSIVYGWNEVATEAVLAVTAVAIVALAAVVPQQARKERPWSSTVPPSVGESSVPAPSAEAASVPLEQGVFELQIFNKGVFANVAPTLYKGEDLDIPTFQRREALINKGTTSK